LCNPVFNFSINRGRETRSFRALGKNSFVVSKGWVIFFPHVLDPQSPADARLLSL
jgi:hypothetical protein